MAQEGGGCLCRSRVMSNVIRRAAHSAHGADWKELVPVNKRSLCSPRFFLIEATGATQGGQSEEMCYQSVRLSVLFKRLITTLKTLTGLGSDHVSSWLSEGWIHWTGSAWVGWSIYGFLYNHLHSFDQIKKQVLTAGTHVECGVPCLFLLSLFLTFKTEHWVRNTRL